MRLSRIFKQCIFFFLFFITCSSFATHFKYADITWEPVYDQGGNLIPNQVRINIRAAYRLNFPPFVNNNGGQIPEAGDTFNTDPFYIQGQFSTNQYSQFTTVEYVVIDPDDNILYPGQNNPQRKSWFLGTSSRIVQLPGAPINNLCEFNQVYRVYMGTCCRDSSIRENNNDRPYYLETFIPLSDLGQNESPKILSFPRIYFQQNNQNNQYVITAVDSDPNTNLTYRFAGVNYNSNQSQIQNFTNPISNVLCGVSGLRHSIPGSSTFAWPDAQIDPVTGVLAWDTTNVPLGTYATQILVEDRDAITNELRTQVPVDILIEVRPEFGSAPVFVQPSPICGSSFNIGVGDDLNFTVAASDLDATDIVNLGATLLPSGATFQTALGNPASNTFSWTPTIGDIGASNVLFDAFDNNLNFTSCGYSINVFDDCDFADAFAAGAFDFIDLAEDGLGPFIRFTDGGSTNGGSFIASSVANGNGDTNDDGDIDSQNVAWGLFANSGETANIVRDMDEQLFVGDAFSIDMDNGNIDTGSTVGFALQNEDGLNLLEFIFVGGENHYKFNTNNGFVDTGIDFTDEGLHFNIQLTSANTVNVEVVNLGANDVVDFNLNLMNPGSPISKIRMFNANAGNGITNNLFFNNIQICRTNDITPDVLVLQDITAECLVNAPQAPTANYGTITATSDTTFPITDQGPSVITWTYTQGSDSITQTQNVTIDDAIPPSFTPIDDFNVTLNSNCEFIIPDYTNLGDAADNCNTLTVTQAPVSGTIVTDYNVPQLITLTADDGNGNITTETFNITFQGVFTVYADNDGDGFGDINNSLEVCQTLTGYVTDNTDCDDTNDTIYPNAPELCDGLDNDCNGVADENPAQVDFANLQSPESAIICSGDDFIAYGQVYEPGVTPGIQSQGAGITVEFGYSAIDEDPSNWSTWTAATFNPLGGGASNDEYQYTLSNVPVGTFYYTFRYSLNGCPFQYGGTNNGFWNGNGNNSGVLQSLDSPVITSISQTNFNTFGGNVVVIDGSNFSPSSTVLIGGQQGINVIINGTSQIEFLAPSDLCPGTIQVVSCGNTSNALNYTVSPPEISNISPDLLLVEGGQQIVISGSNFSSSGNLVTIGGQPLSNILSESPTSITIISPANLCSGTIQITTACGITSTPVTYAVNPPVIVSLSSNLIEPGTVLTISGNNFNPGENIVTVNGIIASIETGETFTDITITVPDLNNACSADIVVTTCGQPSPSFGVESKEVVNPVITDCPATINTIATSANGAVVNWVAPSVSDNCGISDFSITTSPISGLNFGSTFPIGITTVTYTATDNSGNTALCEFDIIVEGVLPDINCPADITQNNDAGQCGAVVTFSASDTAGIPESTITYSQDPGTVFPVGTTTVTATATNVIGTSTCEFDIIVLDNEAPVANCISSGSGGTNIYNINTAANPAVGGVCPGNSGIGATYNCAFDGGPAITVGSFTDLSGAGTIASMDVTLYAACNGILDLFLNGVPLVSATQIGQTCSCQPHTNPGVAMNINVPLTPAIINAYNFGGVNNLTVSTSSSEFGAVCIYGADVQVSVGGGITVQLDASGNASIVAADIDGGSTDNCAIATTSIDVSTFTCADIGANTVTLTVTDVNGNSNTCTTNVTVEDIINPEIICPSNITDVIATSENGAVVTYAAPTGTDNCTGATTTLTEGFASGATFPIGTTTVSYTITDPSNNTATCSFDVEVIGLAPVINCPADITQNNDAGQCGANVTFEATDTVGIPASTISYDIQSGSFFDVNTTTVTATATNAIGSTSCTFTVTVNDTEAPVGSSIQFPAPTIALNNIPEAANYNLIFELNIPNNANWDTNSQVSYSVNNAAALNNIPFTRVAYMMELDGKWVWVSFDQITQNYNQIGIPADYLKQQTVSNMNVFSSTNAGVSTGTGIQTGNVEFWSNSYGRDAGNGSIPSGNDGLYDFNDNSNFITDGYGSFQVHNYANAETLFAFNAWSWSTSNTNDLGIGNNTTGNPDWTFASNAATYNTKKIYVLALNNSVVCNDVTLTLDTNGQATLNLAQVNSGATDNCGVASSVLSQTNFDCSNIGENTVTLTITDIHGNSSTCTSTVTVEDTELPTITCPADIDVIATSAAGVVVNYQEPIGTDNCPNATTVLTAGFASGETFPIGITTVTYQVSDASNNTASCSFDVEVVGVAPQIVCPADIIQINDAGQCGAVVTFSASDAVGIPASTLTYSQDPGTVFPVGTTTVTATANNAVGADSCEFTITVIDDEIPVINGTPANISVSNDPGSCDAKVFWTPATVSDNCPGATISSDYNSGDTFPLGTTTVNYTASDAAGNNAVATSFTVTVEDNEDPVAICPADITVSNDPGDCSAVVNFNTSFTDNCTGGSVIASPASGSTFDVGTTLVTVTATDAAGNTNTCTFNVTVIDDEAPIVDCFNLTVTLDDDGNGGIDETAFIAANGSTDNCEIASISLSETAFNCDDIGGDLDELIISEYVDGTGNNDWIEIFNGTGSTIVLGDVVNGSLVSYYSINIYTDGSTTPTTIGLLGSIGDRQVYKISHTDAPNISGNPTNNFGSPLMVFDGNDAIALSNNGVAVDVIGEIGVNPGSGWTSTSNATNATTLVRSETVQQGNVSSFVANFETEWTAFTQNDVSNLGGHTIEISDNANNVILTVTDIHGNVATCEGSVTVVDATLPEALCQNVVVQLDANGNGSTTAQAVDNGSNDACGIASLALSQTQFTCADIGANPVTLTVTDSNGNESTCTATVTVLDEVGPAVVCNPITVQLDSFGNYALTDYTGQGTSDVDMIGAGSTDACGIATMTVSPNSFTCADVNSPVTVTLTVTDINNNVSSCQTTVTVEDNVDPEALCQPVTVTLDEFGDASITPNDIDDGSNDACGIASRTLDITEFSCTDVGAPVTVVLTVTDNNGNTSTCESLVTVLGDIPTVSINAPEELPEFCQGAVLVLTTTATDAASYLWSPGGETTESIEVGPQGGTFTVTVTSATNCSVSDTFTVAAFDASTLLSAYTILAEEEVFLHGSNLVQSGGIGATDANGLIKLHQATNVIEFGRAANIVLNQGSTIVTPIYQPAEIPFPDFVFNDQSNNASPDVTINTNQSTTLGGSVYGTITVRQGATVTFSQSDIYIDELRTFDGAAIEFSGCANVFINTKFMLAQNGTINANGNNVVMYVNEDVQIEKGSYVRARIHSNGNELLAKGPNGNANNSGDLTQMIGLFIAKKVHGNKNVVWNADDLCAPCPISPTNAPIIGNVNDFGVDAFDVLTWPNPSDTEFNVQLKTLDLYSESYIEVFDISNKLVFTGTFKPQEVYSFGKQLEGGVYIVKVQQGQNSKTIRLVKY